jgi:heme/copper-type cytochrome/quinol oxidase subunit 2
MRAAMLGVCALLVLAVFAAMFLTICRAQAASDAPPGIGPGLTSELLWAAIPCLMVIAAVTPAAVGILVAEFFK